MVYVPPTIGGVTTIFWVIGEKVIAELGGITSEISFEIMQASF